MRYKDILAGLLGIEAVLLFMGLVIKLWNRQPGEERSVPAEVLYLMGGTLGVCLLGLLGLFIYRVLKKNRDGSGAPRLR